MIQSYEGLRSSSNEIKDFSSYFPNASISKTPKSTTQSTVADRPYLDRMTLSKHAPLTAADSWKKLLIQPVSIPNLGHTGIHTAFGNSRATQLTRPDGMVTSSMKKSIRNGVRYGRPILKIYRYMLTQLGALNLF